MMAVFVDAALPHTAPPPVNTPGPGSIEQAHQRDEWIDLQQLYEMRRIIAGWWGVSIE